MSLRQPALNEHKSEIMRLKHAVPAKPAAHKHSRRRKKLWDLPSHFHCSVIGTCLTLDELRRLCRKANIVFDTAVSDHELHSAFVNVAGESAYSSRLLQKHLDNKYKRLIQQLQKIRPADELQLRWNEAMQTGEVASAFWALITHPFATVNNFAGQFYLSSPIVFPTSRYDLPRYL